MSRLRLGLAQLNATVGDLDANMERISAYMAEAAGAGVDVLAFPELAVCGYPPEDLLLRPSFATVNRRAIETLAARTSDMAVVVGFADRAGDVYNAAALLHGGRHVATYRKRRLPNYGVFDELRYFRPGSGSLLFRIAGAWIGITICEDLWLPGGPLQELSRAGADIVVNINASPFHREKWRERHSLLATRASDHGVAIGYVNMVGGQDELVFDGESMVMSPDGEVLAESPCFEEDLLVCDIELERIFRSRLHEPRSRHVSRAEPRRVERHLLSGGGSRAAGSPPLMQAPARVHDDVAETWAALLTGTRDYVRKNGFTRVLLGLSGGVDSALVATIAVDALGADAVTGVWMPSRYSSERSRVDAQALIERLGIASLALPIEGPFQALQDTLADVFAGCAPDVTEENLQARVRGNLLMALSNKFGWLLLTTGNKSEMATGYSTLYGDMAGGFAVLKDVPKTMVYELAHWRNAREAVAVIPRSVLERAPSAELRADQKDSDSLPPYDVLDPILERYVEDDWSVAEIIAAGADEAVVRRVVALVDGSEYKRRQAPPGVRITPRAFGKDRRLPITNRFRP